MAEPSQLSTDDLAQAYTVERARAIQQEADPDAWLQQLSDEKPSAPAKVPGEPDQATSKDGQPMPADPMAGWLEAHTRAGLALGRAGAAVVGAGTRMAKDIGQGIVETPGAVFRGVTGAVKNMAETADTLVWQPFREFEGWLNSKGVETKLAIPDATPEMARQLLKGIESPAKAAASVAGEVQSTFEPRESNTGKMVEFASQWITSTAIGGKISEAAGMAPGALKRIVDAFVAGGAGFDPKDKRLSDTIDEMAPNFVTNFLKARPDDSDALARFKSGLEMAGLQATAEGVIKAFQVVKGAVAGPPEPRGSVPAAGTVGQAPKGEGLATEAETALGGQPVIQPVVAKPAVAAKMAEPPPVVFKAANSNAEFADQAAKFLKGVSQESPVAVNVERFEGPEQIKQAIADMSRLLSSQETVPMRQTLQAGKEMGLTPEMLPRLQGGALDSEQISSAWMLYRSSVDRVAELSAVARQTGAPADIARFNAAFQMAHGILQTVKGQSAEIARALQIHSALRKAEPDMVKALTKTLEESGGAAVSLEMAERVFALKDPRLAAQFIAEAAQATTREKITYVWSNILLSNPSSHVANVVDTSAATFLQVPETWFASKIGGDVAKGEATARLYGILGSMRDGVRAAARTVQTGESSFAAGTRVEGFQGPFATSQDLVRGGLTRQAGDYFKMLIPTRLMQAGDEFTKLMNYRGEMNALAWRDAIMTKGLQGAEAEAHALRLINDPPTWLKAAAEVQAVRGTFNEPLQGFAASVGRAVDQANIGQIPVGRFIAAFVRTPTNLIRWTFHHTPAAFLSPLVQSEIAAGGAVRDMALARIATGSMVLGAVADQAANGRITGAGPKDPELKAALMRTGWQPYSIKVGNKYISYNRSGTIGALVGLAADATELINGTYTRQKEVVSFDGEPVEDSTAVAVTIPFANALMSKTYMQQVTQMIDALHDPNRYGEGFLQRSISSWVPSGVGAIERAVDPEYRRASSWLEAVRARVPGLSSSLPPRLNLWGEPTKDENGAFNLFLPTRVSEVKGTEIDREIARMKLEIVPPKQIQQFSLGGAQANIKLSPEQHNRLIELAGNGLKMSIDGKEYGAREFLDATIAGKTRLSEQWKNGSDEKRELIIKSVLTKYREGARAALLRDDQTLRELVSGQAQEKARATRTPRAANAPTPTLN